MISENQFPEQTTEREREREKERENLIPLTGAPSIISYFAIVSFSL